MSSKHSRKWYQNEKQDEIIVLNKENKLNSISSVIDNTTVYVDKNEISLPSTMGQAGEDLHIYLKDKRIQRKNDFKRKIEQMESLN